MGLTCKAQELDQDKSIACVLNDLATAECQRMSAVTITAKFTTKDPLASHHTHSGHDGMMAIANIADGTMDFCCLIRCGLRLATGWMVSCRASAIRLYVCKTWKGPIDMNLAVS